MDIARILRAICSGKSRKEVYNLLSPEEKNKLNSLSSNLATNRRNRRALERKIRKNIK
jgi:hypothetical protein